MAIQFCVKGNPYTEIPEIAKDSFFGSYNFEVFLNTSEDLKQLERLVEDDLNQDRISTIHVPNKDRKGGTFFSLTSHNSKISENSYQSLEATVQTAANLGGKTVVIHGNAVDIDPLDYDNDEATAIQESQKKLAQILTEVHNPKVKLALETQPRRVYDTIPNYGISANVTPKDFENIQFLMGNIPLHICFDAEHVYKAAIGEFFDGTLKEAINKERFKEISKEYVYAMDKLYRDLIAKGLPEIEIYIKEFVNKFLKPNIINKIAVVHACGYEWKNHCIFERRDFADLFIPRSHTPPVPGVFLYLDNTRIIDQIDHVTYLKPLKDLKTKIPLVLEFDRTKRIDHPSFSDGITYTNCEGIEYSFKRLVGISTKCLEEQINY